MVNVIKIEYCSVYRDIRGNRYYEPIDITDNVNIPLLNVENLDSVLDKSTIELDNTSSEPFEPFTRFIIRVQETFTITEEPTFSDDFEVLQYTNENETKIFASIDINGNRKTYIYTKTLKNNVYTFSQLTIENAIYRLVDNDTPTQLVFGSNAEWKHTIRFIEPTKQIERIDQDNSNITHTVASETYDTVKETVGFSSNKSISGWNFLYRPLSAIDERGYTTSERFKQPYKVGDILSLTTRLNVVGQWGAMVSSGGGQLLVIGMRTARYWDACTLTLSSMILTFPNGTTQNVTSLSNITLSQAGVHKITQTYTGSKSHWLGGYNYSYTAEWYINVWSSSSPTIEKKSIADAIDRLIEINPTRRQGLDTPKYELKSSLRAALNNIKSPEFSFTLGHMADNLAQIGNFIHGIPRIVPKISLYQGQNEIRINDWQDWNCISFDFLGGSVEFVAPENTNHESYFGMEDYASNFVSNVENAVQTNFRSYTSAVEPFIGGYMSPRTESNDFILTDDNCIIQTSLPIYRVLSLTCNANGSDIPLDDYLVEYNKYITLSSYSESVDSKAIKIYYNKGDNKIKGLNFKADSALTLLGSLYLQTAIKNITGYTGNIKDLSFRITYIPYRNFKARQYKPLLTNKENTALFYNQQANVVDIESYGESMKGALLRTGNKQDTFTYYFDSYEDIPHIGMVTNDGNYIYEISTQIFNTIYKCTIKFSKDFNKLNEFVGIKSDYRQYEISESESSNRNVDYDEFCLLDTVNDTLDIEENTDNEISNDEILELKTYLGSLGLNNSAITAMKNKLSYINGNGSQGSQMSFVYVETESQEYDLLDNASTVTHKICLPISCFSFGNSVALHFKMQDNYAAGTTLTSLSDAKAVQKFVQYSDFYGNIDVAKIAFGVGAPSANMGSIIDYSKALCDFSNYVLNTANLMVDFRTYPFLIAKDSRESISFTYQLNFVTNSTKICIGKSLSEIWGFVGDTTSTLKIVQFKQMPSKFVNEILDTSTFTADTNYSQSIEQNNDYKRLKITAPTKFNNEYIGWGILTNDNNIVVTVNGFDDLYMLFRHKI